MRVGFFYQNIKKGGLDTFLIQLLQHWTKSDELVLFCNASHPGIDILHQKLSGIVDIKVYYILVSHDFDLRYGYLPSIIKRIYNRIFWLFGIFIQINAIKPILRRAKLDRLLVINGGYPAGDACLASTVAWSTLYPDRPAWLNFHNFAGPLSKIKLYRKRDELIDYMVSRSVKGVVSVSRSCMQSIAMRPAFKEVETKFIYNGLNAINVKRKSSLRHELSIGEDVSLIMMLAVYEPRKGHEFIMRVMSLVINEIPDAHLLICGDGTDEEIRTVEILQKKSPVSKHIHLQKHRSDTENLFAQIDLLVAPSQAYESFGYMAVEAMSCSIPVVVTNVGGLPEVVEDGVCGFVVDHDDEDEFARRIIMLLKDKDLRKSMGNQGRRRYETCFTAKKMVSQYETLVRG